MLEINRLNPRKACRPDNRGAKVIRLCPRICANNLTRIFNNSFEKCEYPSELKTSKVIAFFKKVETYNPNNYRPVSLLSCFNKLFEKILCKRLVSFLARHKVLINYQHGFRKLYSTTIALFEFMDNIIRFLDEGNY